MPVVNLVSYLPSQDIIRPQSEHLQVDRSAPDVSAPRVSEYRGPLRMLVNKDPPPRRTSI